jgi:8-hydroxy-5-deazaflavin:NADPH oxidoreductase
MRIGVLGTGMVGKSIGTKLVQIGHDVRMGSRDSSSAKGAEWVAEAGPGASAGAFADAAAHGEVLFNCTSGMASLAALAAAGASNMDGKILIEVANPLDFSRGMPPPLSVCNSDSLGEQIQRTFPNVRVVKALNTMNCRIMVDPSIVPGDHDVFLCGNDASAKTDVTGYLKGWFGWRIIHDLGDISGARGMEMILPIWLRLMSRAGTPNFNFHIQRQT